MTLTPDTRLGPYTIVAALGSGGMGEVYRARDTRLERDVAIKVLPAALTNSPTARERFQREARAVAALQHPNICTIFDVGETPEGQAFLVMELLQGETVQQRLMRGPLDLASLIDVALPLADALEAAHSAGIVHRDIKPANVLLTARGPKLLDFGLAKAGQAGLAGGAGRGGRAGGEELSAMETRQPEALLTSPGSTVGTVAYMSPEQLRGEDLDARTDLFSLGLVIYEMAAGRPAFSGATSAVISAAILHEQPPAPSRAQPAVPARLDEAILKAIEKDRGLRYQHAADMRADLQRLKRDSGSARPASGDQTDPGPRASARWRVVAPIAAIVVAAAVAFAYYASRAQPKLTERDTIVLADFTNTTGDPVFDATLRQGLAIQLQQSPFLSLVSDERIQRVLRLMGQPPTAPLTPTLAREICQRTASAAVLEGSIAMLGTQYVLGLRAKNCRTGDILDEQQVQAVRKEDVLKALSDVASKFRTRVGESLATVKQHDTPLEEVTTPSLEALKAYSAGMKHLTTEHDQAAAISLFKRAIEIDPKFAMAHASQGFAHSLMGESALSAESNGKAYQLRDRASDHEKFFIAATYDMNVTGNLEQAQQTCELWAHTYPREDNPYGLLGGMIYPPLGKYREGVESATRALELNPEFPVWYLQLEFHNQFLGRLDDAESALRRAAARNLEIPELLMQRYDLAFVKDDAAGMEREVARARGQAGVEDWLVDRQAFVLAYSGHVQQARVMVRRAIDLNQQTAQHEKVPLFYAGAAYREALFGNAPEAAQGAAAALALSKDRDVEYGAAFALALSGDSPRGQSLASDLATRFPEDTIVGSVYLPAIRALLALHQREPAHAIDLLQAASRYELGTPPSSAVGFFGNLSPIYVRGLAYLAAHRGPEAAAEFQKILDHRAIVVSDPIGALAHLQLGRSLVMSSETAKAKAAYGDFLTLWKDADPGIPILAQAKAEYAALK